jgi:hypothetical protein
MRLRRLTCAMTVARAMWAAMTAPVPGRQACYRRPDRLSWTAGSAMCRGGQVRVCAGGSSAFIPSNMIDFQIAVVIGSRVCAGGSFEMHRGPT